MTQSTDVDVLIVGAGPTGLALACLLAQYGIKFRIIEKNKTITNQSKAIGLQARTLELFEQLGIAQQAVDQGHASQGLSLLVEGQQKAHFSTMEFAESLTKYPYVLILEQCKTEKILCDHLGFLGCEVDWQSELVDLKQEPRSLKASVCHSEKIETIRARYVVAADGSRSTVRHILRLPFEGSIYENRFILADVNLHWDYSKDAVTLCISKKGFSGFFPMNERDRYRAIGLLTDYFPDKSELNFANFVESIQVQSQVPLRMSDPQGMATYKLQHRCLEHFKVWQVFFAGDAAHLQSPVGSQGINSGIQDAFNLAWKLNAVLKGYAKERLLETYQEERHYYALHAIRTVERLYSVLSSRRWGPKILRLHIFPKLAPWLLRNAQLRRYAFRNISQLAVHYRRSSLSYQTYLSPDQQAGDRVAENSQGLFHAYLMAAPEEEAQVTSILKTCFGKDIAIHTLAKGDVQPILMSFGIFKDGLILVRPDQYAAYCSQGIQLNELKNYLKKFFVERMVEKERAPLDTEPIEYSI